MMGAEIQFDLQLGVESLAYLPDHTVRGAIVLPATTYIEMALAASSDIFGSPAQTLHNIAFHQALIVPPHGSCDLQVVLEQRAPTEASFWIFSRSAGHSAQALHASGMLTAGPVGAPPQPLSLTALEAGCESTITGAAHYQAMRERGIGYGPLFQAVTTIRQQPGAALAEIVLPHGLLDEADVYQNHPVLLDASFQIVAAARNAPDAHERFLPVGARALHCYAPLPERLWAYVQLTAGAEPGAERIEAEVLLADTQGQIVVAVSGLMLARSAEPQPRPVAAVATATAQPGPDHSASAAQLAAIWAEVLQFATIEPHDNFFDLGGDSLMASQIASKAQRVGIEITPQQVLEHPTIAALLTVLAATQETCNA